jgi:hypothetical protein
LNERREGGRKEMEGGQRGRVSKAQSADRGRRWREEGDGWRKEMEGGMRWREEEMEGGQRGSKAQSADR